MTNDEIVELAKVAAYLRITVSILSEAMSELEQGSKLLEDLLRNEVHTEGVVIPNVPDI